MSAPDRTPPLLSICVPTHHGRRAALAELLGGVVEQARGLEGSVEICVSDNASHDGTTEVLDRLTRSAPCRVTYRRHDEDLGLARNLLASVELASGSYCWLLGSDDLLADGALRRACELVRQVPDATGYLVGSVHVDALDPTLRSRSVPRAFHPPDQRPRLIEGLDRIYDECGNAWCGALSWSLVDRQAWLRAASARRQLVLAHPVFPQVVMLAAMAEERPRWGWLAEPLVRQRNATTFLFEHGEVSLATRWTQIIGAVASVWGAVLGPRGGRRWRRRMRRVHAVWGSAADMRATKLYDDPSLQDQARLALACLGAFWPTREYWRAVLGVTVTPVWLTRIRYGLQRSAAAGAGEPARLVLSGRLPAGMVAGGVKHVRLDARNDGRRTIAAAGAHAVTIAQRWSTEDGRPLEREELALNDIAALPQSLLHALRPRRAEGVEIALYAPVAPGSYRVEVAGYQHGHGWLDELDPSVVLAEAVEVRPDRGG